MGDKKEAKKIKSHLLVKEKEWPDLEEIKYIHRMWFILGTIHAGADSVQKIMAVTYLSQFEDLNSEFAKRPVFPPDFQVGIVPYSSSLLELYNDVFKQSINVVGDGQNLVVPHATGSCSIQSNIDDMVKKGAQLSLLYQKNKKNMERFKDNHKQLFYLVRLCYHRDEDMVKNLAYMDDLDSILGSD